MEAYPLTFRVRYQEQYSRGLLILKTLAGWVYVGVPHGLALWFFGMVAGLATFAAWWAVLFTGSYPRALFDLNVRFYRWYARVLAYMGLMTDTYPPFSGEGGAGDSSVELEVEYPESFSRGMLLMKSFFGWLFIGVPHGIMLWLYTVVMSMAVMPATWFCILIMGRIPRKLWEIQVGYCRWLLRLFAYANFLTDEYPPLHGEEMGETQTVAPQTEPEPAADEIETDSAEEAPEIAETVQVGAPLETSAAVDAEVAGLADMLLVPNELSDAGLQPEPEEGANGDDFVLK